MIRRDNGELLAECEGCGDVEFAGVLEFREFVQWLKDQGWDIRKDGDDWEHFCPDCSEEV